MPTLPTSWRILPASGSRSSSCRTELAPDLARIATDGGRVLVRIERLRRISRLADALSMGLTTPGVSGDVVRVPARRSPSSRGRSPWPCRGPGRRSPSDRPCCRHAPEARDAEADRERHRVVREPLADRPPHPLGGDVSTALIRIGQQHGELLTAREAARSMRRLVERRISPTRTSTSSPRGCPNLSFCLKWSRSPSTRPRVSVRWARSTSSSKVSSKPRRFRIPVTGSSRAASADARRSRSRSVLEQAHRRRPPRPASRR